MTGQKRPPRLSVVIPAFNEEDRLGSTLTRICDYLAVRDGGYEILVVDDASTDRTSAIAKRFETAGTRVIRFDHHSGKGAAVRAGVLASRGHWILITDADLSTPIEEIERLEARAREADLVLGSRAMNDSRIGVRQPWFRTLMGKSFNLVIRSLGLAEIRDTQCGFKLIRGRVARELLERVEIQRFAFDVEVVWLARSLGYRIAEVGVIWNDSPRSRVDPLSDSLNMLADVIRLRLRTLMSAARHRDRSTDSPQQPAARETD